MKYKQYKVFDLTQRRPQVLLVGNGLSKKIGWKQFIKNVATKDIEKYYDNDRFQLPNLILSSVVTDVDDSKRKNQYIKELANYEYCPSKQIRDLFNSCFDAVLTTNYTYELEYNLKSAYCNISDTEKREQFAKTTKSEYDSKYLVHTFNQINNGDNSCNIWHIHGECRRKSSLIFTHDEYARLMGEIIKYNKIIGNKYYNCYKNLEFKSWIDYFIMGDLYILGQGFDFSEFDLWWLLLRRIREKAGIGTVFFYEPKSNDSKYKLLALSDLGVQIESLGYEIDNTKDCDKQYKAFYDAAIKDISNKVLKNQEEE